MDKLVKEIFDSNVLVYIMLGLGGVGILLKFIISCLYRSLIKATLHMGTTEHKMIKSLRSKFETNYSMNLGVNNVDIFVDKYVYTQKFCGIYLYTWENIGGQVLLICMLTGAVSAIAGLLYECGKSAILLTLLTGVVSSAVLILLEHCINLPVKKHVIRTNIKDYLENFLMSKLEYNRSRVVAHQGENLVNLMNAKKSQKELTNTMSQKGKEKLCEIDNQEEKIIKDILDEYII
ncbi:hypothetical protein [[Clostridium] polysaccharolyticum]|uniref:Uncharacterized protein n=1 Tax=[Clostridium] polysaccharolyticum TaxID=29364 RepID=A0A1I0DB01_9FIRM|nr:hypothetical protein [[Clostridium] polysaccharolyticum]SET29159.1 hypothetical protein SAMN04487772_11378 [[Clostridium] polysaccharolyticum]